MLILGIDPGSVIVGYSILKKNKNRSLEVIDFGCIIAEKNFTTGQRLKRIYNDVTKLIKGHKPDVLSVETLFFFKNLKTVMPVSQTRGVILLAGEENKLRIMEFTPLQIKMAIAGYGRAEKKQVQKMIEETVDLKKFDLKKNFRKKDDAYDAIGVAICAAIKSY
jgi:crossover junction endodeoxyribonuclease RuvC